MRQGLIPQVHERVSKHDKQQAQGKHNILGKISIFCLVMLGV